MSQPTEVDWSLFEPEQTSEEEYFTQQAQFCLAAGISPSEYDAMTQVQTAMWIEVLIERNKANK